MPEDMQELINKYLKDAIPVTINKIKQENAIKQSKLYLENKNIDLNILTPFSLYYIIKQLEDDKRINFIKNNIEFIRQHDEEIFIYNMLSPKSLSTYLTLNDLKEIRKLDKDIFNKIINHNFEGLFNEFTYDDYIEFYNIFYEDIVNMEPDKFMYLVSSYGNISYETTNDFINQLNMEKDNKSRFIEFILKKYKEKINNFTPKQILKFINIIEDINQYKSLADNNLKKIEQALNEYDEADLKCYFEDTGPYKQKILFDKFSKIIMKKENIQEFILKIEPSILLDLYDKDKMLVDKIRLSDWIKIFSKYYNSKLVKNYNIDDKANKILDSFKIDDIESLFETNYYLTYWHRNSTDTLEYVENKYRKNIVTNGTFEKIDKNTSIFSKEYFKNLKELNIKLRNKEINKSSQEYKMMLVLFINFLKNNNIIFDIEGNNFKEIEKLFYKIVKGYTMTIVYKVSSINDIALFNRLGTIDFDSKDFTIEQIEKYNVKHHKRLYNNYVREGYRDTNYKILILKLLLMIGFNNSRKVLEIDSSFPNLEHLVGNVDVKNIKIDDEGNSILNKKIMNLIFSNQEKIEELKDKNSDLYTCFPRIFNEWEMIKINNKDKNLNIILDFLKGDEVSVPPEYHRLVGLFKYIGCSNSIVNETLMLHDKMLERVESTIPSIKGNKDEYTYEILDIDDMNGLAIGNKTNCCFTILGNSYSSLKHSLTSKDGRILVIKKDGEILAHSWLWRNGNLLCLDNIEISKSINEVDFFSVYLQFFDDILKVSKENEDSPIENITIGYTNFDKNIKGIEKYPCLILKTCDLSKNNFDERLGTNRIFVDELPYPNNYNGYLDSKNVQYLIKGNGNFKLGEVDYNYIVKSEKSLKISKV